jgi:hypothetical protein
MFRNGEFQERGACGKWIAARMLPNAYGAALQIQLIEWRPDI